MVKADVIEQARVLELQSIDSTIIALEQKLKNLPEREQLVAIAKRVAESEASLIEARKSLEDATLDLRRSEVDVESVTDRMSRDEKRLSAGQGSPKELEQLQHEIGTLQKRRSDLEDTELEIMLRVDGAQSEVKRLESDLEGLQVLERELTTRLEHAAAELEGQISAERSSRQEVVPSIGKELLELYEKIRSVSGGIGAAKLVGDTCQGCHLSITPTELAKIKAMPVDEIIRCEECRRILVRV
jgi:uncharacterized protein